MLCLCWCVSVSAYDDVAWIKVKWFFVYPKFNPMLLFICFVVFEYSIIA